MRKDIHHGRVAGIGVQTVMPKTGIVAASGSRRSRMRRATTTADTRRSRPPPPPGMGKFVDKTA